MVPVEKFLTEDWWSLNNNPFASHTVDIK